MNNSETKDNNKKKIGLILLCLLLAIAVIIGALFAFFSDVIPGQTQITAGTLDLKKDTIEVKQNGTAIAVDGSNPLLHVIQNMNPGDVVTVDTLVKNVGNKSAYLRSSATITGDALSVTLPAPETETGIAAFNKYIKFAPEVLTQTEAQAKPDTYWTDVPSTGIWSGTESIINGDTTLPGAETDGGVDGEVGEHVQFTIYMAKTAKNIWQDKKIQLDYKVEAIQFRNNASKDWTEVVTTPFGQ